MINVKAAVDRARIAYPNFLLLSCEELDNGLIFFGRNKGETKQILGAVGLFVATSTPDTMFVPMAFYAQHDKDGKELDISRFQTPEERRESLR